ncbi:MAG: hypothetical protein Q8K75_02045 [Chlamydiales bacterium]|nr:hypothetical protein [Chlamydiales bacterium]
MRSLLLPIFSSFFALLLSHGPLVAEVQKSEFSVFPAMYQLYHPVSTRNPKAQESFNKGLTFVFAYNHDLAFREFEKASQIDPNLAMAYWGMAVALGQNINTDVTPENEKKAYAYSQKALSLLSQASPVEQAYIKALVQRYTNDPNQDLVALRFVYRDAMKKVMNEYPEDLDAATLYAESILNLDPWKYWTWDGKPKDGTLEARDVLENVLNHDPDHIGANHFYIHAVEASPWPERALLSAFRLTSLLPISGHLLHMPNHIFLPTGYYQEGIETSNKAIAQDWKYIDEYGMKGEYPLHYLTHNLKVLVRVYMLSEDRENAIKTANELHQLLEPHYAKMPHLEKHRIIPMEVLMYFHRWKTIVETKVPKTSDAFVQSYWHFGRAVAYLKLGDIASYQREKKLMLDAKKKIASDAEIANNPAVSIIELGELVLDAAYSHHEKDLSASIATLRKAVDKQDRLEYDEPPAWYLPLRIELGKALLEEKQYNEAEQIFRKELTKLNRNGRLLYGLFLSLRSQDRSWDTYWVEREMKAALRHSTTPIKSDW